MPKICTCKQIHFSTQAGEWQVKRRLIQLHVLLSSFAVITSKCRCKSTSDLLIYLRSSKAGAKEKLSRIALHLDHSAAVNTTSTKFSRVIVSEWEHFSYWECTVYPLKVTGIIQKKCSCGIYLKESIKQLESLHTCTHKRANALANTVTLTHTHKPTNIYGHLHTLRSLLLFVQTQSNDFWIAIKQSLFCLAGHLPTLPPPSPALQPHHSRISFPPRIPLKRCHVGWRQSAETLLRYSCSFSKAPNSIYGHIYYHVCQWLKGSFIIRSTHLIWSQQAASLGQYALYYTVRASRSTEEKENMSKQKTR